MIVDKFFKVKKHEFDCKCGCGHNNVTDKFLLKLNVARQIAKIPFIINSGCRCKKHNERVGGSLTSAHLVGLAADISCPDSHSRFVIIRALLLAGFKRIGVARNYIHVDDAACEIKPDEIIWHYYRD